MTSDATELPRVCAWVHHDNGALPVQSDMLCSYIHTWHPSSLPRIKLSMHLCCIAGITNEKQDGTAKSRRWGKSRPFMGQVVAVEGLCQLSSSDDKDTIRVEVDLGESGLQYTPGDALGVYPLNCTQVGCYTYPAEQAV